ncbi:unnamed protein product [Timema podura]|uniref:Cullin family profile domain-containing protein n=1 Tax=Timema podura TaxID=61482 RepID=A0ABN7NFI9_TIMPD|nr:unnamed protein product [Timema podura]
MSLKPKKVNFNETWNVLQETVKDVITLAHVPRGIWNDRFSDVYSLCVAYPEPLADHLYKQTKEFLHTHVLSLLDKVQATGESNLLKCYHDTWMKYSRGINYLHRLYLYLNQQHIKKQKLSDAEIIYGNLSPDSEEQMEIGELGLEIWKQNMIEPLKEKLVFLLLQGIHEYRLSDSNNNLTYVLKGVIDSFVSVEEYKKKNNLKLYQKIFEEPYLESSGEFYKREASRLLQECNISQYLECVTQRLEEERLRSNKFLHHSSMCKVKARCVKHMVADHLSFLHGECKPMVQQERNKDLNNMFQLLRLVNDGISVLITEIMEHIKTQGIEAVIGLKGDNVHMQFVENMLTVYKKYREMINVVFADDQSFVGALDKACSSVINHRPTPKTPCRSPEMLAKYCDALLKKSSKGMSETEVDERLSQSITIFKYIDDKDVFQKFYSRMLAKRLIHQQSQSMDAEEAMINRLKQACGYEFTNKLHRMFTDISLSSDLNNRFSSFLKTDNVDLGIHFSINVLQAGAWPLGPTALTTFAVPQELEKSVQMFENFYHNRFNGRKLTWLHHLCQAELKLNYLKRPYQITMQTFQMAILLLFETSNTLSYSDVQELLQLNSEQFSKHVASLIESKLITASTETLSSDTVLSLNLSYSNKRTKFRITAALQRESPQEVEQTLSSVDEDRKLYLQAAIVRIMKSRKVLRHNALIQEVLSQSKVTFAPSISMIKKCIEALIDKQYIERTPNSSDEYSYVA